MRILACNSPYGTGGIGQHFAQLVEETREAGNLEQYLAPKIRPDDPLGTVVPVPSWHSWLVQYTPLRYAHALKKCILSDLYDRRIANHIPPSGDRFMGFVGKALHSFKSARARGIETLELVAANSHVQNVQRLHRLAAERSGVSDSWLHDVEVSKTMEEYTMADSIYVHSQYAWDSFLDVGISESKLERTYLRVNPQFRPPDTRVDDDTFRIVYVGRLNATKGIHLLLDAYESLALPKKQLTLVGGWSSRTMRKYIESRVNELDSVEVAPGDPLPPLQSADVFVHPSYQDGFGYAPMEALACGVPVIVTEDTGMKEYVISGRNGFVVPTGSAEDILDRLHQVFRQPLASTRSLLPASYYAQIGARLPREPAVHA